MSLRLAYLGVIIIWATTPLAIKWSSEGVGFLSAVTLRMMLGIVASWIMLLSLRQSLPLHRRALLTYLASGLNIYLSMCLVYWAAGYIPSGWVSVVFGLSPILTGSLAILILHENALTPGKLLGMLMGLVGLVLIFGKGYEFGPTFVLGITAVLVGVLIHSVSAVVVKQLRARISGAAATTGGLSIATPLYVLTWMAIEGGMPDQIPARALWAILYLGLVATTLGFAMYYYILTHMDVSRVALITLITPICALGLGYLLNNEPLGADVMLGTAFIVSGLLFHEYGQTLLRYLLKRVGEKGE